MYGQTAPKAELMGGALTTVVVGACAVVVCTVVGLLLAAGVGSAASSSTINFQARLETNTGSIAPDGAYNVEFKLYNASSGGTAEWTEDYTYNSGPGTTDARLRVANGYLTVNLGSLTAFPGTINWNQQQWLTINVGGTVSSGVISWDGEMAPRVQLTAVPYAFQAGSLSATSGTYVATLGFVAPTATETILLPATTGTQYVCYQNDINCGFASSSGGSGYVQLQGSTPGTAQTGSFNITGTGILSALQSATGASGTTLTVQAGAATSGTNSGGTLLLQGGAGASTGASGSVIVKANTHDSTSAFQVQNAAGSVLLNVDASNRTISLQAANDDRTVGAQLYSGNFSSGWTASGWNVSGTTTAIHTAGNTSSLINTSVAITPGTAYEVWFKLTGSCAPSTFSSLGIYIGGTLLGTLYGPNCSTSYYSLAGRATTTTGLTFTPSSDWPGTISSISIYPITGTSNPVLAVKNNSGSTNLEVRTSADVSNTFVGLGSGSLASTGNGSANNTALGTDALASTVGGAYNTAIGSYALQQTAEDAFNVAVGSYALQSNDGGGSNTAVGSQALQSNSTGQYNSALGANVLLNNTTGSDNTAVGENALTSNGVGTDNAVLGFSAANNNTSGSYLSALGEYTLCNNTTGTYNTALGYEAGCADSNGNFATPAALQNAAAIGTYAQVQASNSIVLGSVDTTTKVGIGITVPNNIFSVSPLDYQTGTATRTNSSATLVGTSTTWTSALVGDLIVFADGTTNTVAAFTDATHITLGTTYTGTTDASPVHYRFHKPGFQVTSAGNAVVQNTSTTAFQIQNAAGTSNLFVVDTVDTKIGIGTATPTATLTVNAPSGYTGNIIDLQVNGSSKFSVDQSGNVTAASLILTNSSPNKFVETFQHMSSELGSDQTTNSTTLADVWSITFTTARAATIDLTGAGEFDCTAGCASPHYLRLQLVLDGVVEQETPLPLTTSSFALPFSFNWSTGYQAVSAGSHTAKLRWAVDSAGPTAAFIRTLNGSPRSSFGATAYYY